jgi:hypothetical protein
MWQLPTGKEARLGEGAPRYQRHHPQRTLLYRLVNEYYSAFLERLTVEGRTVPGYVRREFEEYLRCGRLEHGSGSQRVSSMPGTARSRLVRLSPQARKPIVESKLLQPGGRSGYWPEGRRGAGIGAIPANWNGRTAVCREISPPIIENGEASYGPTGPGIGEKALYSAYTPGGC